MSLGSTKFNNKGGEIMIKTLLKILGFEPVFNESLFVYKDSSKILLCNILDNSNLEFNRINSSYRTLNKDMYMHVHIFKDGSIRAKFNKVVCYLKGSNVLQNLIARLLY